MPNIDTPNKPKPVFRYIFLNIASVALAIYAVTLLIDRGLEKNTAASPDISPPVVITPHEPSDATMEKELREIKLIDPEHAMTISGNPYEKSQYENNAKKLALTGDFSVARLKLVGVLPNELEHFLSVNVGTESGVLNAVRNSYSGLDIVQTQERQGVFSSSNPINITIDLMDMVPLATTASEFANERRSSKLVRFWDFIEPPPPTPSVNYILAAPFNKNGIYDGEIRLMSFEFACASPGCDANICNSDESPYSCVERVFGETAANEYSSWYKSSE